jgi:inner membrane transporter RhtA
VVSIEGSATLARLLIPTVGIAGTVGLRMAFAAIALLVLQRQTLHAIREGLWLAVPIGAVLVGHHLCFYEAIARIPLGVAVTLEFVGPLLVAVAGSRRVADVVWAVLAAVGVALVAGLAGSGNVSAAGAAFALAAGALWAGYILLSPVLSRRAGAGNGLAAATVVGALIALPLGLALDAGTMFSAHALALGACIAVLSDFLGLLLVSKALTRLPGGTVSILLSTEPGVGALFGLVALGQHIAPVQWTGMAAVVVASVGVTRTTS